MVLKTSQVLLPEPGDVLELLVAVGMLAHGLRLLSLALDRAMRAEQLLDHGHAYWCACVLESLGDLRESQIGPSDVVTHRVARSVVPQHMQEVLLQLRDGVEAPLASAPWPSDPPGRGSEPWARRTRSERGSGSVANSCWPWRMVLGSQPRTVAMESVPPCPSLAASRAAERRRSFSESES